MFKTKKIVSLNDSQCVCKEIISDLIEKFSTTESKKEKLQILTILPNRFSINDVATKFNCTSRMVKTAKEIKSLRGILAHTEINVSTKQLDKAVQKTVIDFYHSPEVSRTTPGKKDVVVIPKYKSDSGEKKVMQKQLMLLNINEAYTLFKEKYLNLKVGLSKFAELRPCDCVLLGSSGSHVICVCKYHENIRLMFEVFNNFPDKQYIDEHKKFLICENPSVKCKLLKCNDCPSSVISLVTYVTELFSKQNIEKVSYKNWVQTDRPEIVSIEKSASDFAEEYAFKLNEFVRHEFISKIQTTYVSRQKNEIDDDEIVIEMDFAENFSNLSQDEIQSVYFSKTQTSVHLVVLTYKKKQYRSHQKSRFYIKLS